MTKLLDIKVYGCEILRKIAEPVSDVTPEIRSFIDDMMETMYQKDGIGIAASQVGLSKRIFICDYEYSKTEKKNPTIFINPEFIEYSGEQTREEGCLSVPGVFAEVVRFKKVKMKYFDLEMNEQIIEADGVHATMLQHEFDHLNGVLFIDKINSLRKMALSFKLNKLLEIGQKMSLEPTYHEIDPSAPHSVPS